MKTRYKPDKAAAAAELWELLARHEGEDADAQLIIERHLEKYADAQFAAFAALTDIEGRDGFRIVLDYDNYQDGARVLNADGAILGQCYRGNLSPDQQFVAAMRNAISAHAARKETP